MLRSEMEVYKNAPVFLWSHKLHFFRCCQLLVVKLLKMKEPMWMLLGGGLRMLLRMLLRM